jgi:hypothetical protein
MLDWMGLHTGMDELIMKTGGFDSYCLQKNDMDQAELTHLHALWKKNQVGIFIGKDF